MRLDHVLREAPAAAGIGIEVEDLAYDHRLARPGTLFFCVPGFAHDGHAFAPAAVDAGAVALVAERPLNLGVPDIVVPDTRAAMALAAATFFGDPTASLLTVGVTGTNGKTTSAFLLRALLLAGGRQTGLLGTVKSVIGGVEHPTQRTTPEAIDLQRTFRAMRDEGDRACVMEVSSHALALRRADAIHFAAALFTNLTQDHLDFHPTMEDYFLAKRALFVDARPDVAVVNIDDSYGARLAAELPEAVTYSLRANAHFRATEVETDIHGSRFVVGTPAGALEVRSPLRGEFNVYNVLGALATAVSLELPAEVCVDALRDAQQVPGRFEQLIRPSRSRSSSTTPILRTPWRTCCMRRATSPPPRCGSCSAAAVIGTAGSGLSWALSAAGLPTRSSSRRTIRGPRTPMRSSPRFSREPGAMWHMRSIVAARSSARFVPRSPGTSS